MRETIWYLSVCICFISVHIVFSRCFCFLQMCLTYPSLELNGIPLCIDPTFSLCTICWWTGRQLPRFIYHELCHYTHEYACIYVIWCLYLFHIWRRGIAGSHGISIFIFLRNLHTYSHCRGISSHSNQQCREFPFSNPALPVSVIIWFPDNSHSFQSEIKSSIILILIWFL